MLQQLAPALRMTLFLTLLTGLIYPGRRHRPLPGSVSRSSQRQPRHPKRPSHRLRTTRPKLQQTRIFPSAPLRGR